MKFGVLGVLILLPLLIFSFTEQDTLSIKGSLEFNSEELKGDFWYTIKNNTDAPQKNWTVIINPSVNILSVQQNGREAPLTIQNGNTFRAITINFSQPIKPHQRESIFIKFSILPQNEDPRFLLTSNSVFLDARKFWFPYPDKDHTATTEIMIKTPHDLHAILGNKLSHEAIIISNRFSTWKNELPNLSPSMSLIITDKPRKKNHFLNVYTDNDYLASFLFESLDPFWNILKSKHKNFPLTEIHIIPWNIQGMHLPADGEFLGTLFLLDHSMVTQYLQNPLSSFFASGTIDQRIIETIIHELYHSYFPGIIAIDKKDYLFMESFIQYLTWKLIEQVSPEWGNRLIQRTSYLLQNLMISSKNNDLLSFISDTSVLYASLEELNIDNILLVDTLIEKYRFVELSKQDIIDTIEQYYTNNQADHYNSIFLLNNIAKPSLFNSTLKIEKTNLNIIITNKRKIISIPVQNNSIDFKHNFPGIWKGIFFWINKDNTTNSIPLSIENGTIWETNIIGSIKEIFTKSPLDLLELDLIDNRYNQKIPFELNLINDLNNKKFNNWDIESEVALKLNELTSFTWKWYNTYHDSENNTKYIQAFLLNGDKNIAFVIIKLVNNKIIEIETTL